MRLGRCMVLCAAAGLGAWNVGAGDADARAAQVDSAHVRREIRAIERATPLIADRGAVLFWLSKQYASLGELDTALALLRASVATDEGFDPTAVAAFAPLRSNRAFAALADRAHARNPAVHRARLAFTIAQPALFPEGLAYDSVDEVFYAGSEYQRKIVKVSPTGAATDFVRPNMFGLMPVGGLRVDPTDATLWAATDGPEFVHFDSRGRLLGRFSVKTPGPHILNDLVVRNSREVYLTDSRADQVYRFDRRTSEFSAIVFGRPLRVPNGITLSPDGRLLYVADDFGVVLVDLASNRTQELAPSRSTTLAGIDGMYCYRRTLIGVQYGTGAFRVMRWGLSPDGRRVVSSETLERGTPLVHETTTGAVARGNFYFFANTGLPNLDKGAIVDSSKLRAVDVAVVRLDSL